MSFRVLTGKQLPFSYVLIVLLLAFFFAFFGASQAHAALISAMSTLQGTKTVEMESSRFANKCIDVRQGSTAPGAIVQMYDCLSNDNQKFTIVPVTSTKVHIKFKGMCFDVAGGGTSNGTRIILYGCRSLSDSLSGAQTWTPISAGVFKNTRSGRCLDGESGNNLTQLKIWDCNGLNYQYWYINDLSSTPPTPIPTNTPVPTLPPYIQPTPTQFQQFPQPTPTPIHIPGTSTVVRLTLLLHGIGNGGDAVSPTSVGNTNPLRPQRLAEVQIYDVNNNLVADKDAVIIYEPSVGIFKSTVDLGNTLPSGAYTMRIKTDQFLRTQVPGIVSLVAGASNQIVPVSMTNGDVNNDNKIDIVDYNAIMGCYSDLTAAVNCPAGYQSKTDMNDDGAVNFLDYNLFLRELTKRGE